MAEMIDKEWEKLHGGIETRRLLNAVDKLETFRGTIRDDGHRPPPIRNELACSGVSMDRNV